MEHETIDVAPENEETKLVPITALLEMAASRLGVVVCGWAAAVLVQGGLIFMLQTKDRVFVTVMFLLVCFRYWGNLCPLATDGSLTEASRSLSANNRQQLAVPIHFIRRFFYWCKLVSAMTSVVLSIMRLASHDFGQTEVANMADRNFALIVFYGLALAEALLLLFALTFVTIMAMQRTVIKALFKLAKPSELAPAPPSEPAPAAERLTEPVPAAWFEPPAAGLSEPVPALWFYHAPEPFFEDVAALRRRVILPSHTPTPHNLYGGSEPDSGSEPDGVSEPDSGSEPDVRPSPHIWSDFTSDIAILESDDHSSWESDDLAWLESDDISLRHPHSDFECELI